jgi:hypothetical protein
LRATQQLRKEMSCPHTLGVIKLPRALSSPFLQRFNPPPPSELIRIGARRPDASQDLSSCADITEANGGAMQTTDSDEIAASRCRGKGGCSRKHYTRTYERGAAKNLHMQHSILAGRTRNPLARARVRGARGSCVFATTPFRMPHSSSGRSCIEGLTCNGMGNKGHASKAHASNTSHPPKKPHSV